MTNPRICLLYTGGTIGMVANAKGHLLPGDLAALLAHLPQYQFDLIDGTHAQGRLTGPCAQSIALDCHALTPLLDSSAMASGDWVRLSQFIADNTPYYSGFAVLHGTDSMAYSASALAYACQHLPVPIVFTGAQIPLSLPNSDGIANTMHALYLAAGWTKAVTNEVLIVFADRLLRAVQARKMSSSALAAFAAPNGQPLGYLGHDIQFDQQQASQHGSRERFTVHGVFADNVTYLPVHPGLTRQFLGHLHPQKMVVLAAYGTGNINPALAPVIANWCANDIVVAVISQCVHGSANTTNYAISQNLADLPLAYLHNITPEAAISKAMWALANFSDSASIRQYMTRNVRGEMTV